MKILVTGTAGFIGSYCAQRLANEGHEVVSIDSINSYYDTALKYDRLRECGFDLDEISREKPARSNKNPDHRFLQVDITDKERLTSIFRDEHFDAVCHLAAQAGVRYSIENPYSYIDSNIIGFTNILECCRAYPVKHLVYASSSSVYGANTKSPFSESDMTDSPVSLYAATKKSNELMAYSYSSLYGIPTTGLRFFTVYGPWGRPDMAPMLFAHSILSNKPITVFNNGNLSRDFTYIGDITEGVIRVLLNPPVSQVKSKVYNIGCSSPVALMDFIKTLEDALSVKAIIENAPMQPGDVLSTYADTTLLEQEIGYKPQVKLEQGLQLFAEWFRNYYRY